MELTLERKKDRKLFYKWVPKWLGALMFLFLFLPIMFVNGAYTTTVGEMTSGLGIISEHIQFASFLTSIGMIVFAPFLVPLMRIRRPKIIYVLTMFLFSVICAQTTSIALLFVCSFILGILKITLILNTFFTLVDFIGGIDIMAVMIPDTDEEDPDAGKKDRFKSLALPLVYLFFLLIGQFGSTVTAWLAHEYEWQYVYWWMCGFILLALLLVLVLMKYQPRKKKAKMNWVLLGDMIAASFSLSSFVFILIYGKTLDWFDNTVVCWAGTICLISTTLLVFFIANSKKPYIVPTIFKSRRIVTALLLFFLLMVLNSSSMFVNVFTGVSMSLDNIQSASLSNWSYIGYFVGAIAAFIMVKKNVRFKYMFAVGFGLLTISAVYMYFQYQSAGLYENMALPIMLRSTGMIMLYALCGTYGMLGLQMNRYLGSWIFLMLLFRSLIGPVVGTALYSNVVNNRTLHYTIRLAEKADRTNPEVAATYDGIRMGMIMQGKSYEEAEQMATMSVKGRIQRQATLAALKEITGWTIYFGIGCTILVLVYPYNKRRKKIPEYKEAEAELLVASP